MPKQQQNNFKKEVLFVGSQSVTKLFVKKYIQYKRLLFFTKRPKV
jgi:hypothetical protein